MLLRGLVLPHKWMNEIPPSTFPKWNIIRHKAKAQKEAGFIWSVIHKAVAVNERRGKISMKIDKSCPHCGPQSVESIEHMFYNCPLAQQGWQHHLATPCKILRQFNRIWFFLEKGLPLIIWRQQNDLVFNNLQWPIEKTWQIIWDTPDVSYPQRIRLYVGVKNLIMTWSNSIVTWMDSRPQTSITFYSWFHSGCAASPGLVVLWITFAIESLNLCPSQKNQTIALTLRNPHVENNMLHWTTQNET